MTAQKFKHNGYDIRIVHDDYAEPPENLEKDMFLITTKNRCFQPKHPAGFDLDDIRGGSHDGEYHTFPLYMYQHSGTRLSLSPFSCPWDSGQVGFVMVERASWSGEEEARKAAGLFIESWNQYLCGDVYGYQISDENGEVGSCYGLYGMEYAVSEATEQAEALPALPVGGEAEDVAHEETLA